MFLQGIKNTLQTYVPNIKVDTKVDTYENIMRKTSRCVLPLIFFLAMSNIETVNAGPISSVACLATCAALTFGGFLPACQAACALLVGAPIP